jgi:hypothetical protein
MVALHSVPLDNGPLDDAIGDAELVIALDDDAALDGANAALLSAAADRLDADAWFADIRIGATEQRRPAWSPTRIIGDPTAACPLAVRAGWLRSRDLSPGDVSLPFRLAEENATVAHLPVVLTRHDQPVAGPGREEIDRHLLHIGVPATVERRGARFVLRPAADFAPTVSVVIPTAGANVEIEGSTRVAVERLLDSIGEVPDRIEFLAVVGDEYRGDPTTLASRVGAPISVLHRPPGPFNFSAAVNLGLLAARHDLVLMLNDDMESTGPEFIDAMAIHLSDPTVAAVGARLLYPDGSVQHAGMVIDDARPLHPFVGWNPADTAIHGGDVAHDVIAVTGGCLMARRSDLLAVGGLSTGFPLSFNDVDLCIRLRRSVGRVVVEPQATLAHHETLTRVARTTAEEWDRWIFRWGEIVDPWYHPGHHRPDDPHRLHLNADHLDPAAGTPRPAPRGRTGTLRSRVHRGRAAPTAD